MITRRNFLGGAAALSVAGRVTATPAALAVPLVDEKIPHDVMKVLHREFENFLNSQRWIYDDGRLRDFEYDHLIACVKTHARSRGVLFDFTPDRELVQWTNPGDVSGVVTGDGFRCRVGAREILVLDYGDVAYVKEGDWWPVIVNGVRREALEGPAFMLRGEY
jgi:hypothetical protein